MVDRGDAVLYAISARRQVSWQSFSAVVDAVYVPDERLGPDLPRARRNVALVGSALGHWDLVSDGNATRLFIAPPVLALLPRPGLPTAILCGSRSPDTRDAFAAAAASSSVRLRVVSQTSLHPFAPSRIEIVADSAMAFERLADSVHIEYRPEPAAWTIALSAGSVTDYVASANWSPSSELDWEREDFDPINLRFSRQRQDTGAHLRLSSYEHPGGWTRRDILWRNGDSAFVDRDWARFAVLADYGSRVTRYDHARGTLSAPVQVPLPHVIMRAVALSSGQPPRWRPGTGLGTLVYGGVPLAVADVVMRKLGQSSDGGESS